MKIYMTVVILFLTTICSSQTVMVEWDNVRQPIHGFGASDAWFSDEIMQHPNKDQILDLLFSRENGAGLSILRHHVPPHEDEWKDGVMQLTSGDLDMGDRPYCAVRFTDLEIPQGATIDAAHIQFTAKDNRSVPSEIKISAQAADNALAFSDTPENISSRPQTDAVVIWDIPDWRNNQRGDAQKTPNLQPLFQEIVNRSDWQSGNSIVLIFQNYTGKRSARTFDDDGGLDVAPELTVELGSGESFSTKVSASTDDAEEEGKSYITYGAQMTQEAFARGCELVWAAAWSPPAKWKTNNDHEHGGFLKKQHYQDFADYLEMYRKEMDDRSGIPLYGISPQNEPGYKSWQSCEWEKNDFRDFIRDHLGPTLDPDCRIITPETTNWNAINGFYKPIYEDETAHSYVDIVAGHVYGGNPDVSYNKFGKPTWETEWSYNLTKDDLTIESGLTWAYNFWRLLVNAEVSASHHWWAVNMKDDGRQQGLIAAARGTPGLDVSKRLWAIGNYSNYVRPGWRRIVATKAPLDDVYIAAFKDSSTDEFAIVAINNRADDQPLTFDFDGFEAGSVVPYRTSSSENLHELDAVTAGDSVAVTLEAKTITTFVGTAGTETDVSTRPQSQPELFTLKGNYPNPFNPVTTIQYSLAENAKVLLQVYDLNGRLMSTLVDRAQSSGEHRIEWRADENGAASGVYVYRLRVQSGAKTFEQHRKMLLVK